jgi:hypothetical protein
MEYEIELYRTIHHYVTVTVDAPDIKTAVQMAFDMDDGNLEWDEDDEGSPPRVNSIDGERPEGWVPVADIYADKLTGIAAMEGR